MAPHLSKQRRTLLQSKGTAGNKSCVSSLHSAVTSSLYLAVLVTCALLLSVDRRFRPQGRSLRPSYLSAVQLYMFTCLHIYLTSSDHLSYLLSPLKLKKTKIWSKPIHPPSRFPIPGHFHIGVLELCIGNLFLSYPYIGTTVGVLELCIGGLP